MPEERRFAHPFHVATIAIIALAVECGLVFGYFAYGFAACWELSAHGAMIIALAVWCCWSPALRADMRLTLLLIASTAALGPVGPAGTLVTMCLSQWFMRRAIPFEEWYRSLFPDTGRDSSEDLAARIAAADTSASTSLTPFAEVLAFGSAHQKQALISLINQHFRPAFGPILKLALNDRNYAVRVQAATAMNKLENAMLDRTLELSQRASENPGDLRTLAALARHYDEYLYCGILDGRREEEVRARALEAYRQCIAAQPGDLDCRLAEGRLLLRARRYAEAAHSFEKATGVGLSTPQARLWYMESLYHLGRFDQLRAFARSHSVCPSGASDLPPAASEVVELWSHQEPAPQTEVAP
jgi:hypothetical protein